MLTHRFYAFYQKEKIIMTICAFVKDCEGKKKKDGNLKKGLIHMKDISVL